ncbi:MAG: agmatinase family protein [Bdellovibrionaceae bacterium]|nr:agmatinase family protein [Pseudobdellovibrionaceae bacterium]
MANFDPSTTISSDFGIFGIPCSEEEARLVLLPVPWDVTTSYGSGASEGPRIIRKASEQIDLFDFDTGKAYEAGYFMLNYPEDLKKMNDEMRIKAQELIQLRTQLSEDGEKMKNLAAQVNKACEDMTSWVYRASRHILDQGKLLGLVGGDHSTPFGAIRAISDKYEGDFGILHIDAHADLRQAYQGFTQSHASIMFNVMHDSRRPLRLVQVGIRDFCEEEYDLIQNRDDIVTFFDADLKRALMEGRSWNTLCDQIVGSLPKNVYISFDIDGLDPVLCPNTGTPVPGGLSFDQANHLLRLLVASGRKIVGFDLNEVSTGGRPREEAEWDGNVGARILYKLCGWTILSNPREEF